MPVGIDWWSNIRLIRREIIARRAFFRGRGEGRKVPSSIYLNRARPARWPRRRSSPSRAPCWGSASRARSRTWRRSSSWQAEGRAATRTSSSRAPGSGWWFAWGPPSLRPILCQLSPVVPLPRAHQTRLTGPTDFDPRPRRTGTPPIRVCEKRDEHTVPLRSTPTVAHASTIRPSVSDARRGRTAWT